MPDLPQQSYKDSANRFKDIKIHKTQCPTQLETDIVSSGFYYLNVNSPCRIVVGLEIKLACINSLDTRADLGEYFIRDRIGHLR